MAFLDPVPSWAAPAVPPSAFTLAESVRRAGHYAWVEARLFEMVGAWVVAVPEPELKAMLADHAARFAWHAELWHGRLPAPGGSSPPGPVEPPDAAFAALLELVGGDVATSLERLVGLYRVVVPHAVVTYTAHLAGTGPVSDGPVIQVLRLVLAQHGDTWREGEAAIEWLRRTPDDVVRAADRQARLESLLVTSTGLAGRPEADDPRS